MSEFKFACPVCGQHITADSSTSGSQIECPTCFQKIVVPQAPASTDSKFILSASQVGKPRPLPAEAGASSLAGQRRGAARFSLGTVALLVLVLGAGAAAYVFREQVFKLVGQLGQTTPPAKEKAGAPSKPAQPGPVNTNWTLNLANAPFPDGTAGGRVHGSDFVCERAILEGRNLALRQGQGWPPPLGVVVILPPRPGGDWSGQTVEIAPDQPPPIPRVILRWRDGQQQPAKEEIRGGYALKVAFGQAVNGRITGKIYLCVPDEAKSFVAGNFDAEIRKPPPPKPRKKPAPK
jgi:DNA-directed RNA polymerase subunit RPC12/RpoP